MSEIKYSLLGRRANHPQVEVPACHPEDKCVRILLGRDADSLRKHYGVQVGQQCDETLSPHDKQFPVRLPIQRFNFWPQMFFFGLGELEVTFFCAEGQNLINLLRNFGGIFDVFKIF